MGIINKLHKLGCIFIIQLLIISIGLPQDHAVSPCERAKYDAEQIQNATQMCNRHLKPMQTITNATQICNQCNKPMQANLNMQPMPRGRAGGTNAGRWAGGQNQCQGRMGGLP